MNTTYLRGQLYYADLSKGVGSEQEGYRPVLIIQNDVGNKYSPTVIVAAVTSKVGVKPKLPTHYFIEANTVGLTAPSIVLLEQLRTLDKRRLERYIGRVLDGDSADTDRYLMRIRRNLLGRIAGIDRSRSGDPVRRTEYETVVRMLEMILEERGYHVECLDDLWEAEFAGTLCNPGELG